MKSTKATKVKSIRFAVADGKSRIAVNFCPKGEAKSQVVVDQSRLARADEVEKMRRFWSTALGKLKSLLEN